MEFSLDRDESAITRLKKALSEEVKAIEKSNRDFFIELKEAMGIRLGREEEHEKGTEKGREFETILYDRVAEFGRQMGDFTEKTTGIVGDIPRNKKGDIVITLGDDSGAPGSRIVIEAKKELGYRLKDAIDELNEAKKNRDAQIGIFAFSKGAEPSEVGDFRKIGNDFFITVDDESLVSGQSIVYIESSYKIGRALMVASRRKREIEEIDVDRIRSEVDHMMELLNRFSNIETKVKTIKNNSEKIEEILEKLHEELTERMEAIMRLIP